MSIFGEQCSEQANILQGDRVGLLFRYFISNLTSSEIPPACQKVWFQIRLDETFCRGEQSTTLAAQTLGVSRFCFFVC